MPRRIVERKLLLCVLLMFGTAAVADDEVLFDLSAAAARQDAARPVQAASAESLEPDVITEPAAPGGTIEPPGVNVLPESPPLLSVDEPPGLFGWRPAAPHFTLPSRSYSLFRSPVSYGWAYPERCAPTPWKPRGDGIPRRTSCYRMDYAPYQLENDSSKHGPAFYMRYELYPCEECHKHAHHLQRYYGRRY